MQINKKIIVVGMGLFEEQAGGANKYMTDFSKHLFEIYKNVEVFVPKINNQKFEEENYKFKVHRFENLIGIKSIVKRNKFIENQFKEQVLSEGEVIINSHFAFFTYPLLKLCKKKNISIITHFHGPWALETKVQYNNLYTKIKYNIAKHIEKKVYNQSKYLITLSEAFKQILIDEYGISPHKILVIKGATDINQDVLKITKDEAKEKLGWDKGKKYILTIRRLVKRMGIDLYLDAIKEVDTKGCKFIIGGKGELKEELEEKARKMSADIDFCGYIADEDIAMYYRAADLYFLPTIELEGFGLVTIEAMGYGTPVIATNVGGSKEILHDEAIGVLINPNKEDFKVVLNKFIENSLLLPSEKNLIDLVKSEYNWTRVVESFLKLVD